MEELLEELAGENHVSPARTAFCPTPPDGGGLKVKSRRLSTTVWHEEELSVQHIKREQPWTHQGLAEHRGWQEHNDI